MYWKLITLHLLLTQIFVSPNDPGLTTQLEKIENAHQGSPPKTASEGLCLPLVLSRKGRFALRPCRFRASVKDGLTRLRGSLKRRRAWRAPHPIRAKGKPAGHALPRRTNIAMSW